MGDRLIEQRLLRRAIIGILAEPLDGAARDRFCSTAEDDLNRSLPAPGRQQMRASLRVID
jgi:hypothetical protein